MVRYGWTRLRLRPSAPAEVGWGGDAAMCASRHTVVACRPVVQLAVCHTRQGTCHWLGCCCQLLCECLQLRWHELCGSASVAAQVSSMCAGRSGVGLGFVCWHLSCCTALGLLWCTMYSCTWRLLCWGMAACWGSYYGWSAMGATAAGCCIQGTALLYWGCFAVTPLCRANPGCVAGLWTLMAVGCA
jgi:hypothetical protein